MATHPSLTKLHSNDKNLQNEAFQDLMTQTTEPIGWAYDIWDDIVKTLTDKDNRRRSIAAQVLSNLAKSDPENRMKKDFPKLLNVTRDDRFVTARHCLESLWKVAIVNPENRKMVVGGLTRRFNECESDKNCTLIRYDITVVLRKIADATNDPSIRLLSEKLIATEADAKYARKYTAVWKAKG
ncbi:MAG: hypothetical protein HYX27_22590 [Acidobacteria bacterium]|nr:hypothetical protein [Acidobacteriota bacterium]